MVAIAAGFVDRYQRVFSRLGKDKSVETGLRYVGMKSDLDLQRFIEQELLWTPSLDARNLKVTVHGRIATLKGSVPSPTQRTLAQTVAQQVADCQAVVMDVVVRPRSTPAADDAALATAVLTALAWQKDLPGGAIRAVVDHGCVTLTGNVEDAAQSILSESVVGRMRGVLGVVNRICVCGHSEQAQATGRVADVEARIAEVLFDRGKSAASSVHVNERDGVIRLTGKAASALEKSRIEQAAWSTDGARWVISQLEVS